MSTYKGRRSWSLHRIVVVALGFHIRAPMFAVDRLRAEFHGVEVAYMVLGFQGFRVCSSGLHDVRI